MTFDEKLTQALKETFEERVEQSLTSTKRHRFSLSYRLWERKMLRDLRNNRLDCHVTLHKARHIVKVLAITAAIVLSLTACAVVKLALGRFSFDDKNDYSNLFIENLSSYKTRIEKYYGLPKKEGWAINEFYADDYETKICYTRNDKSVIFKQNILHGNMGIVNPENVVVEPISIFNENDGLFIEYQHGDCGLWWIYDGYLFSITGNLNKEKLINLAHSTKIIEL